MQDRERCFERRAARAHSKFPLGFMLLLVGVALLARQLGVMLPDWMFTWQMLVIVVGLSVGAANRFSDFGWLILVAIGTIFLIKSEYPGVENYLWPFFIILVGLVIIFRPPRQRKIPAVTEEVPPVISSSTLPAPMPGLAAKPEMVDVTSVFGATRKIVLSKNLKGGDIVSVFGGAEINLSQADFQGPITIDVVAIFGGVKLVVPSNWEIRSETAAIMGGIDDKRDPGAMTNPEKVILLDGVALFGGIEINSY